uniref:Ubiquitin-like domain-containing protein n=1 Tax=Kryptolebias marmoratus TaxID=37003 RepID=A0A3Q2ZEH3_KRYMA
MRVCGWVGAFKTESESFPMAAVSHLKEVCLERSSRKNRSSSRKMGKIYQVMVHGLRGEKMFIDLCNTEEQMQKMTVLQLKEKIAEKLPETTGQDNLRLIFTDKMLDENTKLLSKYGIQNKSVIQMVIRVPGGLTA